jgi:major membrane immunogen (membrane-anchored lipoprotein)
MRVRLVSKEDDKFLVMIEQASGKGKRVTTGATVSKSQLRQEARRLVEAARGEGSTVMRAAVLPPG